MILKDIWLDVKAVQARDSGGQKRTRSTVAVSGRTRFDLAQICTLVL